VIGILASQSWNSVHNERAYLYKAVLNEARRHHRGTMRRRAGEAMAAHPEKGSPIPEVRPDVLRAVGRLSLRQRAVVYLAYWEDLTPAEIARRLGVSASTVYRTLARGESHLRRWLDD
jgi:RNA polymerase sigma-70 factor (ECF subfamily)